jgi:hypothetical protein
MASGRLDAVRDRLAEMDMLRCSFSGPGEMRVVTPEAEADLRGWVEGVESAGTDGEVRAGRSCSIAPARGSIAPARGSCGNTG